MATRASFETDLKADLKRVPSGQAAGHSESQVPVSRSVMRAPLQWNHMDRVLPAAPGGLQAAEPRTYQKSRRKLHRKMTREQGCALEMIGHAVDYLNDGYLQEGAEDEIIDFSGPSMEAIQILIFSQREVLRSLPLTEPLSLRLWNMLLRRKSQFESSAVIPLSSSR